MILGSSGMVFGSSGMVFHARYSARFFPVLSDFFSFLCSSYWLACYSFIFITARVFSALRSTKWQRWAPYRVRIIWNFTHKCKWEYVCGLKETWAERVSCSYRVYNVRVGIGSCANSSFEERIQIRAFWPTSQWKIHFLLRAKALSSPWFPATWNWQPIEYFFLNQSDWFAAISESWSSLPKRRTHSRESFHVHVIMYRLTIACANKQQQHHNWCEWLSHNVRLFILRTAFFMFNILLRAQVCINFHYFVARRTDSILTVMHTHIFARARALKIWQEDIVRCVVIYFRLFITFVWYRMPWMRAH